jgi:hypothetical protein
MSFADDLNRFARGTAPVAVDETLVDIVLEAKRAMQFGSELTGSPGSPVDSGNLRNSWQMEFESPRVALISTTVVYAAAIEDGVGPHGPLTLRSAVGGFHSRKLLIAGWSSLVEAVQARRRSA